MLLGEALESRIEKTSDKEAAESSCVEMDYFLKKIGMDLSFEVKKVAESELPAIADVSVGLPDYEVNAIVAISDEILEMLNRS